MELAPSYSKATHDYSQEKRTPKVYSANRVCCNCSTVLSIYNRGPQCFRCQGGFVELDDLVELMSQTPEHP